MPSAFETEISLLLTNAVSAGSDARAVAEELVSRWQKNLLSPAEQTEVAQFLVNAGYFHMFFSELQRLAPLKYELPWSQFVDALSETGVQLARPDAEILLNGASEQGKAEELLKNEKLDTLLPESIAPLRQQWREKLAAEFAERRQELREKLVYMRANRMFEQELNVLDEIQAQFPDEAEVQQAREALNLRWARNLVGQTPDAGKIFCERNWQLENRADRLPEDQRAQRDLLMEQAAQLALARPESIPELAITLHMMDLSREALALLNSAPETVSETPDVNWLRLELTVQSRQYIAALSECTRLELLYSDQSETSFTVSYARARSYYGLGQKQQAIELLKSIVRIRPGYKAAQALLSDWSEGES